VDEELRQHFINRANELGFDTGQLIWVQHNDARE
jgi:lipocalin